MTLLVVLIFALAEGRGAWQSPEVICEQRGLGAWPQRLPRTFPEPGKAPESNGSLQLKLCFLKACHSPDAILMGMESCE